MLFNINNSIRVKLNNTGRQILKDNHDEYCRRCHSHLEYRPLKEDENGYVRFQMWDLMETFGEYCKLGSILPFDPEIEICE